MKKKHEEIQLLDTPSQSLAVKYKENLLCSRYDPEKEAQRLIEDIEFKKFDLYLILGIGLGYHLKALLKNITPQSLIIAVEKEGELFNYLSRFSPLKELISSTSIIFSINEDIEKIAEKINKRFSLIKNKGIRIIEFRPCLSLNIEYYKKLINKINQLIDHKVTQSVTLSKFGRLWQENLSYNLKELINSPKVKNLFQKFKDHPAIIISAGPSLDKNIHHLKKAKEKTILICVDTALKALLNINLIPDLVVSIDPQERNFKKLENISLKQQYLIVADITYWKIPLLSPNKFFYSSNHPFTVWLEKFIPHIGILNTAGGSVATVSIDLAVKMGCNPIILVGQDLSFEESLSHAKGTYKMEEDLNRLNKFLTLEMLLWENLKEKSPIMVKGNYKEKVYTNKLLDGYRRWIEEEIKRLKGKHLFINATEGGAYIEGTKILSLEEAILRYCPNNLSKEIIFKEAMKVEEIDKELLLRNLNYLKKELDNLEKLSKEVFSLYKYFEKDFQNSSYLKNISLKEKKISEKEDILDILEVIFYSFAFHKLQNIKRIEEGREFFFRWHFIWYEELINSCNTLKNMIDLIKIE